MSDELMIIRRQVAVCFEPDVVKLGLDQGRTTTLSRFVTFLAASIACGRSSSANDLGTIAPMSRNPVLTRFRRRRQASAGYIK